MARYKVNPNTICSSKKLHMNILKENHKALMEMVVKEEIVIKRQAYVKVFGNLVAITPSEVARFEKEMTIIWK